MNTAEHAISVDETIERRIVLCAQLLDRATEHWHAARRERDCIARRARTSRRGRDIDFLVTLSLFGSHVAGMVSQITRRARGWVEAAPMPESPFHDDGFRRWVATERHRAPRLAAHASVLEATRRVGNEILATRYLDQWKSTRRATPIDDA